MFKRLFDIIISFILIIFLFIPIIIIIFFIILNSWFPIIHWSKRIGKNNEIFLMPKFRTMKNNTPDVATHLLLDSNSYITRIGFLLRKFSLDEIPQLFSVIKGDMSFVGPRPALYNQYDLKLLRESKGIHKIKPGITGLAQINGRDSIDIKTKVDFDYSYLLNQSNILDIKIIFLTIYNVLTKKNIKH